MRITAVQFQRVQNGRKEIGVLFESIGKIAAIRDNDLEVVQGVWNYMPVSSVQVEPASPGGISIFVKERQPVEDFEEIQASKKPFIEIHRQNERSAACEDDCEVTAIAIGEAERFEPGYLKDAEEAIFQNFLKTGRFPTGMYPKTLFDGAEGLPCGGLLTNKTE